MVPKSSTGVVNANLAAELGLYGSALDAGREADVSVLREGLTEALASFLGGAPYSEMRSRDKLAVTEFHRALKGTETEKLDALNTRLSSFLDFLDGMRAINRREVLIDNDRAYLSTLKNFLESGLGTEALIPYLEMVYGRSETLDQLIYQSTRFAPVPPEVLVEPIQEALDLLRRTAQMGQIEWRK